MKYSTGNSDERSSLTFVELAQEALSRSDLADLTSIPVSRGRPHRQKDVFLDADAWQAWLLKTAIVLLSTGG